MSAVKVEVKALSKLSDIRKEYRATTDSVLEVINTRTYLD